MQAVTYHQYGEPAVLGFEDVPVPEVGPREVRIRVVAASVNPFDCKLRAGLLKDVVPLRMPAVPGLDASGVVDEIGEGVTRTAPGDRVFGLSRMGVGASGLANIGTAAEYAVLAAWAPVPESWTMEQAAAAGVASETAFRVLNMLGVTAGTTLLIDGAAGGVGSAAVAVARARGARVIGTASESNQVYLQALGAIPVTYGPGLAARVRHLGGPAVDAALDVAGAGSLPQLIKLVRSASDVVTIADVTAEEHGVRFAEPPTSPAEALAEVSALGVAGNYAPHVEATYSLRESPIAHRRIETRHSRGKLVLVV